jgi:hypothetical protein
MEEFPKYSVDLLKLLDAELPVIEWPKTAAGAAMLNEQMVRQQIWFAAQRALVTSLLEQIDVEEDDDAEPTREDDQSFWTGDDGPRVLPAALDIRQASVGHTAPVDPGSSGSVPRDAGDREG